MCLKLLSHPDILTIMDCQSVSCHSLILPNDVCLLCLWGSGAGSSECMQFRNIIISLAKLVITVT